MTKNIPIWIMVWGFLMGLLPLGFGIVGYVNPGFFGMEWANLGPMAFDGVFGLYVGRNMASAIIAFFALSQRSPAMLIIALLMRIFSDVFDVLHKSYAGTIEPGFLAMAALLIIGSSIAVYQLWKIR